jgi:hypothetical protein
MRHGIIIYLLRPEASRIRLSFAKIRDGPLDLNGAAIYGDADRDLRGRGTATFAGL